MKKNRLFQLLLLTSLLLPGITQAQNKDNAKPKKKTYSYSSEDTNIAGTSMITFQEDGHQYKIKMLNDEVTELIVDDKLIAKENYPQYETLINKIREQIKRDRAQAEEDRKQAMKDREQANRDRAQAEKDREQAEKDRAQAEKDRQQSEVDRKQAMKDREEALKNKDRAKLDGEQAEKDRTQANKDREQAIKDKEQAMKDREQAGRDREQAEKDRQQAVLDREQAKKDRIQAEEDRKLIQGLLADLVKENIVANEKEVFSLVLTEKELLVNGKKQSDELQARLKPRYLKSPNSILNYTNMGKSRQFSVN